LLTEEKLVALENSEREEESQVQIESEHPGKLGARDAFNICTINGVKSIYQQTFTVM
jgi:hypothetical protein